MDMQRKAVQFCENALLEHRNYCAKHGVYQSWIVIVDQMIERQPELVQAYSDIHCALNAKHIQAVAFFDAFLCATNAWHPDRINEWRQAKKRLADLNTEISEVAGYLSQLLQERRRIQNDNPISDGTHFSVVEVVKQASRKNYLFQSWVEKELSQLDNRFDAKYWPKLQDFVTEISKDAAKADVQVLGQVSTASMQSSRASKADFCRALLARVQVCTQGIDAELPRSFHLKDETWASLVNIALELSEDDLIDGHYFKRLRQRMRENESTASSNLD